MYGVVKEDEIGNKKTSLNIIQEDQLDSDHFILVNTLAMHFYKQIGLLAFEIVEFWKGIGDREVVEIAKLQTQSVQVADRIYQVQKLFR